MRKKQLSITPYSEQYLKDRVFDRQRVIDSWIGRYNEILGQGYGGMRLAADLSWLKRKDWKDFTEYEKQANDTFRSLRTLALCAYWLKRFSVSELIDIMRNHCLLLIRQYGRWISLDRSSITTPTRQLTPLQRAFLRAGFEGLNDQEIIELLLSLVLSTEQSRELAEVCISRFKSLRELLAASVERLTQAGIPPNAVLCVRMLHELPAEILRQNIVEKPLYTSSKAVFDYLYYSMRDLKNEVFKVVFLNSQTQIIDMVELYRGMTDHISIRPRDVVENAIKQSAAGLIFAHNHPSGDPSPSQADEQLTRDLVFVGMTLQMSVLDHIIIGHNRYFSFADAGLIKAYETDYLNLRLKGVAKAKRRYKNSGEKAA